MSSGDPQTRKLIFEKTIQLMERQPGQAVRIDDIARAAKISRQAIYLHFGSRAELLIATARHVDEINGLSSRLETLNSAKGAEALDAYVDFWGNYMPVVYGLAKALLALRETDAAAAAAWDDRMSALYAGCQNVIACLAREKLLAPEWSVDQAVDMLWALSSIELWENLTQTCGWTNAKYIKHMKAVLRRTFLART